jgi:hypothetical protein
MCPYLTALNANNTGRSSAFFVGMGMSVRR